MTRHLDYSLVLQLPENAPLPRDFQRRLTALLNPRDDDLSPQRTGGHAYGDGTQEFFVQTEAPVPTCDSIRGFLLGLGLLDMATIAYWAEDGLRVLWPPGGRFIEPPTEKVDDGAPQPVNPASRWNGHVGLGVLLALVLVIAGAEVYGLQVVAWAVAASLLFLVGAAIFLAARVLHRSRRDVDG